MQNSETIIDDNEESNETDEKRTKRGRVIKKPKRYL